MPDIPTYKKDGDKTSDPGTSSWPRSGVLSIHDLKSLVGKPAGIDFTPQKKRISRQISVSEGPGILGRSPSLPVDMISQRDMQNIFATPESCLTRKRVSSTGWMAVSGPDERALRSCRSESAHREKDSNFPTSYLTNLDMPWIHGADMLHPAMSIPINSKDPRRSLASFQNRETRRSPYSK